MPADQKSRAVQAAGDLADEIVDVITKSVALGAVSWDARDRIAGKIGALSEAIKRESGVVYVDDV